MEVEAVPRQAAIDLTCEEAAAERSMPLQA